MMKTLLFLIIGDLSLGFEICNKDLLFSYGVMDPKYIQSTNMLCGNDETETCCRHIDETYLLNNWNKVNRKKIKPYLDGYLWLTKAILNYYEDIIVLSKYIYLNPTSQEECKTSAESLVLYYMYRTEIQAYVDRLEKYVKNISTLRKGFYCSLCSVKNQKYFDANTKKITFSTNFCKNLVRSSIEEIFFKTNQILPTLHHINVVLNCKDGVNIKESMNIMLNDQDLSVIDKCYRAYKTYQDPILYIEKCFEYCRNYQMTSASEIFEGKVGKLDYIYKKIVSSGLKKTDPFFPEIEEKNYNFFLMNPEFFENKLNFQDLNKYENVFETYGLELFQQALDSNYYYGNSKVLFAEYEEEDSKTDFQTISSIFIGLMILVFFNN